MKFKDQQLLEEAYESVKSLSPYRLIRDESQAGYVEISDRPFQVRGQEVLFKREQEDSWTSYSFIDPKTKQRVFKDMSEEEILNTVKSQGKRVA